MLGHVVDLNYFYISFLSGQWVFTDRIFTPHRVFNNPFAFTKQRSLSVSNGAMICTSFQIHKCLMYDVEIL